MIHELLQERPVDRLAGDDRAGEDESARDVVEQRCDARVGGELPTRDGTLEQPVEAAALVLDDLVAHERAELLALAQLADQPAGEVGVLVEPLDHQREQRQQVAAQAAGVRQRVRVRVLGADRVEDDLLLAARPAAIDRGLADARPGRDRLDRHAVVADLGDERDRGPQDRLTATRITGATTPWSLDRHTHVYDTVS